MFPDVRVAARLGAAVTALLALAGCAARVMPPGVGDIDVQIGGRDATATMPREDGDVATGTDGPLTTGTTPYPDADITIELPFGGAEQTVDVTTTATPARVDVHLLIDSTGSYGGELSHLQTELVSTLIPGLAARIPSLTVGVSSFEDLPVAPFGVSTDYIWRLFIPQTSSAVQADNAVRTITIGNGGDEPEDWGEALYQIGTGAGLVANGRTLVTQFHPSSRFADEGTLGGVGFRTDSERVVVVMTDAPAHTPADYGTALPNAHSLLQAETALEALGVRVVGVVSSDDARPDVESVAIATGALVPAHGTGVCSTGLSGSTRAAVEGQCPLVFDLLPDGTGLSSTIVGAIAQLLDSAVYADVHGVPSDDAHGFVQAVEAVSATPPAGSVAPGLADRLPAGMPDGIDDTFTGVHASTALVFRMHFDNRSVPSLPWPQVFFVHVQIVADGNVLRDLLVRVIVPDGPKHDGGLTTGDSGSS